MLTSKFQSESGVPKPPTAATLDVQTGRAGARGRQWPRAGAGLAAVVLALGLTMGAAQAQRPSVAAPGATLAVGTSAGAADNAAAAKEAPNTASETAPGTKAAGENKVESAATAAPYSLGPGDVVAIDVWHEPEISRTLPIQPDGRLSLPLAGEMHVAGMTTEQMQALITTRLKKYMDHPAVTVMLQQANSRRFNIVDMVVKPGSYPLDKPTTVLDAIAAAGGLRDFSHPKRIYVIRKRASDGVEIRFNFNYDQVSRGLHMEQNIQLQPNDTVVVP